MTALRECHHYLCSSPGYHTAAELCFLVAHMLLGCGKCQEGPFHFTPKIRVCSAPPWKATPVRLSCITTGKEASRTSHTVRMSQCLWTLKPFYRLAPALWDMQLLRQQPFGLMQCFRNNLLAKKTETEKEILQFSATPYTGYFFDSAATLLYKTFPTVRSARSAHEFSFSSSHVLYQAGVPVYLHLVIPQSCSLKSNFRWLFKHKPHSQLLFIVCSEKEHVSNSRRKNTIFYLQHNHVEHAKQAQPRYSGIKTPKTLSLWTALFSFVSSLI